MWQRGCNRLVFLNPKTEFFKQIANFALAWEARILFNICILSDTRILFSIRINSEPYIPNKIITNRII